MQIYICKSETRKGLHAFAGDLMGSKLPQNHGPWTVTLLAHRRPKRDDDGQVAEDKDGTRRLGADRIARDAAVQRALHVTVVRYDDYRVPCTWGGRSSRAVRHREPAPAMF
jgi:hypothetical protein